MFKNPRDKTQIVHLARQVYPENISSFHKTFLDDCNDPHSYLFLDFTQSVNSVLRCRPKIFPGENTDVLAAVEGNEPVEVTVTLPPLLKDTKPQAIRALLNLQMKI